MPDRQPLGRRLDDTERELEYSPSSRLPDRDLQPFLVDYRRRSDAAHRDHPATTIRYGPRPANTIDLARPEPDPRTPDIPVHVFIHGGYWQQLSKADSYFLAPANVGQRQALAAVDYTLAPAASVDEIIDECRAAIEQLHLDGPSLGLDPTTMTVSGSSAGAHLALAATLRLAPHHRPTGLVLVSGIYDLEPLIGTSINDALSLDLPTAEQLSPVHLPDAELATLPPTIVAYGDDETDEFKRQSRALVDRLTAVGVVVSEYEVPDRNHFDVVFDIVPDLTEVLSTIQA